MNMDRLIKAASYLKGFNDAWNGAMNGKDMGAECLHRGEYTDGYVVGRAMYLISV